MNVSFKGFFPLPNLMLTWIKVSEVDIFTICLMLPQCNTYEQTNLETIPVFADSVSPRVDAKHSNPLILFQILPSSEKYSQ